MYKTYYAHQEKYRGYSIKIFQDEIAVNPFEDWDQASVLHLEHKRYNLGTPQEKRDVNSKECTSWDEVKALIEKECRPVVIVPVYMIDHSGLSFRLGRDFADCDPGDLDSGMVGFAYVSRKKALEEWGKAGGIVTSEVKQMATKCLFAEFQSYEDYSTGNVYGYEVEGDDLDESCRGYYGDYDNEEYGALYEARSLVDAHVKHLEQQAAKEAAADTEAEARQWF